MIYQYRQRKKVPFIRTKRSLEAAPRKRHIKHLLMASIFILAFATISYAVYTIVLTDMQVENIQIYRQAVVIDEETGETEMQMKMAMNYTLYNAGGDSKGQNVVFDLTAQQKTAILNFVKPFVQAQAATDDVAVPTWAQ